MIKQIVNSTAGEAALSRFGTTNTWNAQQIFKGSATTTPGAVFQAFGTTSAVPAIDANGIAIFQGAEAVNGYVQFSASGSTTHVVFRRNNGTYASPTAIANADVIGSLQWQGRGASTFGTVPTAQIRGVATQAFTEAARGSSLEFYVTAVGAITNSLGLRLSNGTVSAGHNAEFFGTLFLKNATNINFESILGVSESVLGISSANNVGLTSPTASGNITITNRATSGQIQLIAGTSTGQVTMAAGGSIRVTVASGGKTTFSSTAINIETAQTPATSAAAGTAGDIAWDDTYLYVRQSTGWRRIALGAAF
jgi:hypothetical protein